MCSLHNGESLDQIDYLDNEEFNKDLLLCQK